MKLLIACLTALCLSFLISSCSLLTGIRKARSVSSSEIVDYALKNNIPHEDCYELNNSFIAFLFALQNKGLDKCMHDHYQPMQAIYFDAGGKMQSYHINCYANESGAKLNWNSNGVMNQFPPLSKAPLDTLLTLDRQLKVITPLDSTSSLSPSEYDWVIAVYWGLFSRKKSLSLIKAVKSNAALAGNKKVKIIYINNDNFFAPRKNKATSYEAINTFGL